MSKQDGVYTRSAAALEQKHSYGKRFSELLGIVDDTRIKVNSIESSIATIRRTIDQNRSAIELLVVYDSKENPTASGSFIIEAINGASSAKIEADRLDIDGKQLNIKVDAANVTGTFTVKNGNYTYFSAGNGAVRIGGWKVDNNSLWNGSSFNSSNSVFLCTGSVGNLSIAGSPAQENWVFKAGPNYGVNKNGDLWCSSFNLGSISTDELGTYRKTSISNDEFIFERDQSYFLLQEISGTPLDLILDVLIDPSASGTSGSNTNYTRLTMTGEDGMAKGVLAGQWFVDVGGREVDLISFIINHGG
ncbi:MAG: hypothetical protein IJ404_07710 [Clostridia bacterium]|nr:hypothetical protein [Clostridia bacterium]